MFSRMILALSLVCAPSVFAATFKCVAPNGAVTFASVPCPPEGGETTYVAPAQGNDAAMAEAIRQQNQRNAQTQISTVRTVAPRQTITVVPDHTRGTFEERRLQELREVRNARIAAGLEAPRPKPVVTHCYTNGLGPSTAVTTCTDSAGGRSNTSTINGISTGVYVPGSP